jgi:predicted RNA binding protein with dsRBD fold (UPF0201 family)
MQIFSKSQAKKKFSLRDLTGLCWAEKYLQSARKKCRKGTKEKEIIGGEAES